MKTRNKDIVRWFIIICIVGLATTKIVEFNKKNPNISTKIEKDWELVSQEDKDFAIDYILNNKVNNFSKFSEDVDITTQYCKRQTEWKTLDKNIGIVSRLIVDDVVKVNEATLSNFKWNKKLWKNVESEQDKLANKISSEKNISIFEVDKICK